MAMSDYATCVQCDGKAFYDPEGFSGGEEIIIIHKKCFEALKQSILSEKPIPDGICEIPNCTVPSTHAIPDKPGRDLLVCQTHLMSIFLGGNK